MTANRRIRAVDPRIQAYAKLLVERSLDVQPGWAGLDQLVTSRPELVRLIARRGAYPLVRLGGAGTKVAALDSAGNVVTSSAVTDNIFSFDVNSRAAVQVAAYDADGTTVYSSPKRR